MFNFFTKRIFFRSKIVYIINSTDIGGAENIFFNVVKEFSKNDIVIISLTCQGYYGNELKNNRLVCSLIRKRNKAPKPPPKKMDNKILISSYRPNEPVIQSDHLEKIYFFLYRQGCTQLDDPDH